MSVFTINDDNYKFYTGENNEFFFDGHVRKLNAMPRRTSFGNFARALPMGERDTIPLIPRSEWQDRIKQKDADGSWLEDRVAETIPCLNQGSLGYCHAYSMVLAAMVRRLKQGLPFILLSSISIGGPITGWRNEGANPEDDMIQLATYGTCEYSYQDSEFSLSSRRWKDGWEDNALQYKCEEFWDGDISGKTFDAAMTLTLLDEPWAAGYGWWGHAVGGGFRASYLGKRGGRDIYTLRSRNSWGTSYGRDGFFDMEEGKGTPDIGLFSPRVMLLNN